MPDIDPVELRRVLESPAFREVCEQVRSSLTRKVMHRDTSPDERDGFLAEYRALERVLAALENEATP